MRYNVGDIVRLIDGADGLHEITGVHENNEYSVTKDECYSEQYANHFNLIFVCAFKDRKDI